MNLSSFLVTQEVFEFDYDDAKLSLKALNADQFATVEMYLTGSAEALLNQSQKYSFVKKNILGWSGIKGIDGSELVYSEEAKTIFLSPDLDALLNILILECYRQRRATIDKVEGDKSEAGK